jgi:membrane protein required for colicin V production
MNWLDLVLLFIVAVSVISSFRKGLSREIVRLISVVLALFLGLWFYGSAAAFLEPYLKSRGVANFAGFLVVFGAVSLLGGLVGLLLGKFLRVTGLSILDHALGAGFGLIRGMLIAVALIMGMMAFRSEERPPAAVVRSRMAPYMVGVAHVVASLAPHELKEGFRKTYGQVKSAWAQVAPQGTHGLPARKANHEGKI